MDTATADREVELRFRVPSSLASRIIESARRDKRTTPKQVAYLLERCLGEGKEVGAAK